MSGPIRQNYTPLKEKTKKGLKISLFISIAIVILLVALVYILKESIPDGILERLISLCLVFGGYDIIIFDTLLTDYRVVSNGKASSYGILGLIGGVCCLGGLVGLFIGFKGIWNIFNFFFGGRYWYDNKYNG
jgi:hypothetical protein